MSHPALVVIGTDDESFISDKFLPEIAPYKHDIEVIELDGLSHMGIIMSDSIRHIIKTWVDKL